MSLASVTFWAYCRQLLPWDFFLFARDSGASKKLHTRVAYPASAGSYGEPPPSVRKNLCRLANNFANDLGGRLDLLH